MLVTCSMHSSVLAQHLRALQPLLRHQVQKAGVEERNLMHFENMLSIYSALGN